MFSFKFIKNLTAPTGVIRIPNKIHDSLRTNGKEESGVFIPQTTFGEIFRDSCSAKNEVLGVQFSNGLLCSVSQFHSPAEIFNAINSESPNMRNQLQPFDISYRPEIGGGVNVVSGLGFHDLASNYLLIDQNDHSQWFSLINIDRTISFTNKLLFQINRVRCYIRPNYASFENIFVLAGSMTGDLIASELENIALELKTFDCALETVFDFKAVSCDDNFGFFSGMRNEMKKNIEIVNEEPNFFGAISLSSFA